MKIFLKIILSLIILTGCKTSNNETELTEKELLKHLQLHLQQLGKDGKENEKELLKMKLEIFYLEGVVKNPKHNEALKKYFLNRDKSDSQESSKFRARFKLPPEVLKSIEVQQIETIKKEE